MPQDNVIRVPERCNQCRRCDIANRIDFNVARQVPLNLDIPDEDLQHLGIKRLRSLPMLEIYDDIFFLWSPFVAYYFPHAVIVMP